MVYVDRPLNNFINVKKFVMERPTHSLLSIANTVDERILEKIQQLYGMDYGLIARRDSSYLRDNIDGGFVTQFDYLGNVTVGDDLYKSRSLTDEGIVVLDKESNFQVNSAWRHKETGVVVLFWYMIDLNAAKDGMGQKSGDMTLVFERLYAESADQYQTYLRSIDAFEKRNVNKQAKPFNLIETNANGFDETPRKLEHIVTEDDVIMDQDTKNEIYQSIERFFTGEGEFYKKYNIKYKRGIMLYGAPGNGKTTLIHSIVNKYGASLIENIVFWQVNEYARSTAISQIFRNLSKNKKGTLLVIEDIDSLPAESKSTFLNVLDGFHTNNGMFIIATTNHPEKIDPAIMNRAGRFDRSYLINKPTSNDRKQILTNRGILEFISEKQLDVVVRETEGFSMSVMEEIFTSCAIQAYYDKESVDIDKILKSLRDSYKSQQKGDFIEKDTKPLGFAMS